MKWFQDASSGHYALWGMIGGLVFPIIGTLIEIATLLVKFSTQTSPGSVH